MKKYQYILLVEQIFHTQAFFEFLSSREKGRVRAPRPNNIYKKQLKELQPGPKNLKSRRPSGGSNKTNHNPFYVAAQLSLFV